MNRFKEFKNVNDIPLKTHISFHFIFYIFNLHIKHNLNNEASTVYTAVSTQVFVPSIDQTVGFLYLEKKPNSSENPLGRLALGLQCESPNVGGT